MFWLLKQFLYVQEDDNNTHDACKFTPLHTCIVSVRVPFL